MKQCVLNTAKICDECHQCDDRCQLDPAKICDNCFRCLDEAIDKPYEEIPIGGVYLEGADYLPGLSPDEAYYDASVVFRRTHVSTLPGLHAERFCRDESRRAGRYPRHH